MKGGIVLACIVLCYEMFKGGTKSLRGAITTKLPLVIDHKIILKVYFEPCNYQAWLLSIARGGGFLLYKNTAYWVHRLKMSI